MKGRLGRQIQGTIAAAREQGRGQAVQIRLSREKEEQLRYLQQFDTVFLVDDSASMEYVESGMRESRWRLLCAWLMATAEIAARVHGSFDVHFFNSREVGRNLRSPNGVLKVFKRVRPSGLSPINTRINDVLKEYYGRLNSGAKPLNLIVIMDGQPQASFTTDQLEAGYIPTGTEDVRYAINGCVNALANWDRRQVGMTFAQIGWDAAAYRYLAELGEEMSARTGEILVSIFWRNLVSMPDNVFNWTEVDWDAAADLLLGTVLQRVVAVRNAYYAPQPSGASHGWY